MKAALCLSGEMRTYRICYPYLKKHIIDALKPDVFIYTWSHEGCSERKSYVKAKIKIALAEKRVTYKMLSELYHPVYAVIEKFHQSFSYALNDIKVPEALLIKDPTNCKYSLPMFYTMKKCNVLKKEHEKKMGQKYDVVIRLRPDIRVLKPIPESVLTDLNTLWHIDRSTTRISDKFVVSNSDIMDYYTSVWDCLKEYWKNPLGDGNSSTYRINERLTKYHMLQKSYPIKVLTIKCSIPRYYYVTPRKILTSPLATLNNILHRPSLY